MKTIAIVLVLSMLVCHLRTANAASYILRDQSGNQIVLMEEPCTQPWMAKWLKARMTYKGAEYDACWKLMDSSVVLVMDSAGDVTGVPMSAFRRMSAI